MSGSQKTSENVEIPSGNPPNHGIIADNSIFLWNYVLPVGWGGDKPTDEIYTARLHWIKPQRVNPELPIAIDPVNLGIVFNLTFHKYYRFEATEVAKSYPCPNYVDKKCHTVVTCVLSPNDQKLRREWYSYLIEGKGYSISEIDEMIIHLEKYQIEFSKACTQSSTVSLEIETQTGIWDARQKLARQMYPNLMNAFKNPSIENAVFKAFILDHTSIYGYSPECCDHAGHYGDSEFINKLHQCYSKKHSKVDLVNLELVVGWIPQGYYMMSDKQLLEAINKRTGSQFKNGRTLSKRADRLGLTFIRSPGPSPRS